MFIKVGGKRKYDPFAFKKNQNRVNDSGYDISSPGYGVVIMRPKQSTATHTRMETSSKSTPNDGTGPAMTEAARTKFIKGKNRDYVVKKTPQGSTYGVRKIV